MHCKNYLCNLDGGCVCACDSCFARPEVCKTCGFCPTCGRKNEPVPQPIYIPYSQPAPYVPASPIYIPYPQPAPYVPAPSLPWIFPVTSQGDLLGTPISGDGSTIFWSNEWTYTIPCNSPAHI